jgi:hypothetical protein
VFQLDRHLLHRSLKLPWLTHRAEPKHLDAPSLYAKHRVCTSCHRLQQEIEKLLELEFQFARHLGIPTDEIVRYNHLSYADLRGRYANVPKASKVNKFLNNPGPLEMPESKFILFDLKNPHYAPMASFLYSFGYCFFKKS